MSQPPLPEFYQNPNQPPAGRHGCLTAWLIFLMVVNGLFAVSFLFAGKSILHQAAPTAGTAASAAVYAPGILSAINVGLAVAVFQYKKWGFWGFIGVAVSAFAVNLLLGAGPIAASLGLVGGIVGVAILYALLNIGDDSTRAWPRLK